MLYLGEYNKKLKSTPHTHSILPSIFTAYNGRPIIKHKKISRRQ